MIEGFGGRIEAWNGHRHGFGTVMVDAEGHGLRDINGAKVSFEGFAGL